MSVQLPTGPPAGAASLVLSGAATGTEVRVPITIDEPSPTLAATAPETIKQKKDTASISVTVSSDGPQATGVVQAVISGDVVDEAELVDGAAELEVGPFNKGQVEVEIRYLGDARLRLAKPVS